MSNDDRITLEEYWRRMQPDLERTRKDIIKDFRECYEFFGPYPVVPWYKRIPSRALRVVADWIIRCGEALGGQSEHYS